MRNKGVIFKLSAVLLLVMYVMSLGGINVHTCSHTGESFVTFLAGGISCEDIHPFHSHHHHDGCNCCEDHDCDGDDDCCTNDSRMLLIADGDDHQVEHIQAPDATAAIAPLFASAVIAVKHVERVAISSVPLPDSVRPLFSVLRV